MKDLLKVGSTNATTMTSLEIAELTGKQHKHVMRDISNMLDELDESNFGLISYFDKLNREQQCYELNEELSLTLVSGYNLAMRRVIIRRWKELESNVPALPQTFGEALMLAAKLETEKEELKVIAVEAIRTKSEIGDKRQATAMATASTAVRRLKKSSAKVVELERELGLSKEYCSVKRMNIIYGVEFDWRVVRKSSRLLNLPTIEVPDSQFNTVKGWHSDAWLDAYGVNVDGDIPSELVA